MRYAASHASLQALWDGPPVRDILEGLACQRYSFRQDQLLSVIGVAAGSVLLAISLVLQGHKTWRDAGADTAEFVLRALGVPADEARAFATAPLPELPLWTTDQPGSATRTTRCAGGAYCLKKVNEQVRPIGSAC